MQEEQGDTRIEPCNEMKLSEKGWAITGMKCYCN